MMVQNAQGQSHNTNCPQCVYSKNRVKDPTKMGTADESCGCAVCGEKKKKEKVAKLGEQKKRDDALAAKLRAEKDAKQKAFLAEQKRNQEEASKPKSGEVVINAQPISKTASKSAPDKKALNIDGKTIFATGGGIYNNTHFKNEKNEIIIDNPEWIGTFTANDISFTLDAPNNFGVVRIPDPDNKKRFLYNLINAKGEYLLDDTNIWSMLHIRNGWFVVASKPNNYYLLNIQTKKKFSLPYYDQEPVAVVDMAYVPVFSEKVALRKLPMEGSVNIGLGPPVQTKKEMLQHFPEKVNEEVLSRYSFVLFHTDEGHTYSTLPEYNHFVYYNKTDEVGRIEMYGITEKGEMEVIRIK